MSHDSRYETECPHGHGWYFYEDGCAVASCENAASDPIEYGRHPDVTAFIRRFAGWRCASLHGKNLRFPCVDCLEMMGQGFDLARHLDAGVRPGRLEALMLRYNHARNANETNRLCGDLIAELARGRPEGPSAPPDTEIAKLLSQAANWLDAMAKGSPLRDGPSMWEATNFVERARKALAVRGSRTPDSQESHNG